MKLFLLIVLSTLFLSSCSNSEIIDREKIEKSENVNQITLISSNLYNVATTYWTMYYSESGINFEVQFEDDDLLINNSYDIGYDDNFEFLINLNTDETSWIVGKTYHFLMSGNGNVYFERAVSPNSLGDRFSKDMGVVLGENLDYSIELIDSEEFKGFKSKVFIAYDLIGTSYDEAYKNLTFCPAMRNTHIYGQYSKRTSYALNGCNWSNPSTFYEII